MPLEFAPADAPSVPLFLVAEDTLDALREKLPSGHSSWLDSTGFGAKLGEVALLPAQDGAIAGAVAGYGTHQTRRRGRFHLAGAMSKLPKAVFHLEAELDEQALSQEALGVLLAGYRFDRYKSQPPLRAQLKAPAGIDAKRLQAIAAGEALTRDLINTPAADMGPDVLQDVTAKLALDHGATFTATVGQSLLENGFPMIHAVGRAAEKEPRLLQMRWGQTGPKVTLVGKGVCFDTGGLNLKPGASMGLMKKDMGGAATVLGLARMIMELNLPLQLRVLIPAVENNVAGNAFRPGDILTSRKGLTVEVNNTDAEGRLVLADALALADEEDTALVISMATLTGAARVAVGPDLAPFYTDQDSAALALSQAADAVADPVWRMPFHAPYEAMIEPGIADLDNAPKGGFAGSITAALFLRRFVETAPYMHFDIYGWQPTAAPGRPKGGVGMGARALLQALPDLLGMS